MTQPFSTNQMIVQENRGAIVQVNGLKYIVQGNSVPGSVFVQPMTTGVYEMSTPLVIWALANKYNNED